MRRWWREERISAGAIDWPTVRAELAARGIVVLGADADEAPAVYKSLRHVIGCHQIRTRGSADFVFLDLHVWMDAAMPLERAHSLSHVVKDTLMAQFPQIKDAIIHIEPPPHG